MDKIDEYNNIEQLEEIDELLEGAATAIDNGSYKSALNDFEKAIEMITGFFGDNFDLTELKRKVADIQEELSLLSES